MSTDRNIFTPLVALAQEIFMKFSYKINSVYISLTERVYNQTQNIKNKCKIYLLTEVK